MNEEITFSINDTTRAVINQINHLEKWRENNPKCNDAVTDLILDHLHIVKLLSLEMVDSENYPK